MANFTHSICSVALIVAKARQKLEINNGMSYHHFKQYVKPASSLDTFLSYSPEVMKKAGKQYLWRDFNFFTNQGTANLFFYCILILSEEVTVALILDVFSTFETKYHYSLRKFNTTLINKVNNLFFTNKQKFSYFLYMFYFLTCKFICSKTKDEFRAEKITFLWSFVRHCLPKELQVTDFSND